ncbi:type IV pilin protein [Collimonas sp. NPDC087041]|uniref:type IV pilin protein n=1 Tax=Collimonas sp. NPDC087041 TaxID=3363960 RepID=UPI003816997B
MTMRPHLALKLSKRNGFTLIEVMIVAAIVAILSAVAIPAYSNYVIRGKIPIATNGLATEQVQMEQFFQDNQTYIGAPGCTSSNNSSNAPYFTFSCTVATATAYTLKAQGTGSMAAFAYTIDQSGNKTTTLTAPPSGWTVPAGTTCWITRQGGVC